MTSQDQDPRASAAGVESTDIQRSFSPPFFILGCVRSGTTLLRDLLRLHPQLVCPEETHFFRWPEPFGNEFYSRMLRNNEVLRRHREIDGVSEAEFVDILGQAGSKPDLCRRYMQLYAARHKPGASRWFDKTPQNVYGAALIAGSMPEAKFVHIVRDPVNVVASLRLGQVMKPERLMGACNYWNEAIDILMVLKAAFPKRVHELRYEDLVSTPLHELRRLLEFVGEPFELEWFGQPAFTAVDHRNSGVLTPLEQLRVRRQCGGRYSDYLKGFGASDRN
jgi:hypothetical protein